MSTISDEAFVRSLELGEKKTALVLDWLLNNDYRKYLHRRYGPALGVAVDALVNLKNGSEQDSNAVNKIVELLDKVTGPNRKKFVGALSACATKRPS